MRNNSLSLALFCCMLLLCAFTTKQDTLKTKTVTAGFQDQIPSINFINLVVSGITVTRYHPTVEECDSDPTTLADGTKIKPAKASEYRYCAVSRDLLQPVGPFKFGDTILLRDAGRLTGFWTIRDTMAKKFKKRIDILQSLPVRYELYEGATISLRRMEVYYGKGQAEKDSLK